MGTSGPLEHEYCDGSATTDWTILIIMQNANTTWYEMVNVTGQEWSLVIRETQNVTDSSVIVSNLSSVIGDAATKATQPDDGSQATPSTGFHNPVLAVVLGLFCIFTVFGNVLVMVAVAKERYLHTVTNYFIVSLATADCLVGAIVMPFSVIHEAMAKFWVFGGDWCDLWHSIDVLGSTASIGQLAVISLDRYWAITDPITYPSRMSTRRACVLIAAVWISSALISFPAIAWWRAVAPAVSVKNECTFTFDIGYLLFSSIISFYAPLIVMLFTYYRIYRAATEQTRSLRLGSKQVLAATATGCAGTGDAAVELTLRIHRGGGGGVNGDSTFPPPSPGSTKTIKHFSFSRRIARLAKEQKAAKTLGIVMGVFVLCWMPFFLCNVLLGVCGSFSLDCFNGDHDLVSSVVTWLGWINSGMNPVIYACWSRDFRRAFTKILCMCCPHVVNRRQRHRMRSRVCQSVSTPISSTGSNECVRL